MALEMDPHRLEQRQKQIDFGLATTGYANYVSWLKSTKGQVKPIPIPNIYVQCSKRSWDGQIRHWRRLLHLWDAVELPTGTPGDRHFQDPCAGEAEYNEEVDYSETGQSKARSSQQAASTRMESPTPLSSVSLEPAYVDPRLVRRSYSDDFTNAHGPPNHLAPPQPFIPQMPMHMHPHQAPYQLPNQMMSTAPPMGYMYPAMPPPGWQLSFVPTGYAPVMPAYAPTVEQGISAELLMLGEKETLLRSKLFEAECVARQELLHKQYVAALTAASAAQKELARQPPAAWNETSIGMLLSDEFGSGGNIEHQSQNELLPPSLAEPPRCNPGSPAAVSDSGHSLASLVDLRLDEERYHNFRRHFGEAGNAPGLGSLESPPPCWSPARLTPGVANRRGVLSASPGLTPSPNDWFVAQRSPVQVSPRAALAFADWASPHPGQSQETSKGAPAPPEPSMWPGASSS